MTTGAEEISEPGLSLYLRTDGILIVRLDRPEKLNALEPGFWPLLVRILADYRECARAIILTGSGDKAFCAGGDIASFDLLDSTADQIAFQTACMEGFLALESCPIPVIAAVNGLAAGGGCELAMACDIVIASEQATFSLPESALGLVPGYGILRGSQVIGRQWLNLLVMTGESINAATALQIGLVQKVVASHALMEEALRLAERIVARPATAIATAKILSGGATAPSRVDESVAAISKLHATDFARQSRRDFIARRNRSR